MFRTVYEHPYASRLLRAQARVAQAAVGQHKEIVSGKPTLNRSTPYVPYLKTIRLVAHDFLDAGSDLTQEEQRFLQALTVESAITTHMYTSGWALPASSRQPWDVTAHNAERSKQDVPIHIGLTDDISVLGLDANDFAFGPDADFAVLRAHLKVEPPDFEPRAKLGFLANSKQHENYKENLAAYAVTENFHIFVRDQMFKHIRLQAERGVDISAKDRIKMRQQEKPLDRDVSESAVWYLLDFDGTTLNDYFVNHLTELNRLRQRGIILPEERTALSWMQLDYAQLLALDAGEDKKKLDAARLAFENSITYFEGLDRMCQRLRRFGEAYDAQLAARAADVLRGLYTSSDKFKLRKVVKGYHENIGSSFDKIKAPTDPDQVAAWRHTLNRVTLSLALAAAQPEMRHLLLPAPPRVGPKQVGLAFPVIFDEYPGYDIAAPVAVELVEGDGIEVNQGRIHVGRDALLLDGDPLALLRALSGYLAPAKGNKRANLQEPVQELTEKLAYAISDADQLV